MRIVELEIKNWEKHNPRNDVKTARWFKMSNEFFSDPEFYSVSLEGRLIWIYLLCAASKKLSANIKVNTQMIADILRVSVDLVDYAILDLERCGSIMTSPVTLVIEHLRPDRKDNVTIQVRALEERREEKKRGEEKREEKREDIITSPDSASVISALNSICVTSFRNSAGHKRHIEARVKEGFTFEDFVSVIKFKNASWSNDAKMAPYLRPETLFGNKMDSYLQESKKPFKPKLTPTLENPLSDPYLEKLNALRNGETA